MLLTTLDAFLSEHAKTKGFNNILQTLKKLLENKVFCLS